MQVGIGSHYATASGANPCELVSQKHRKDPNELGGAI
jgi:hypothetical protein